MKYIRCTAILAALVFSLSSPAADAVAPAKKQVPSREQKRAVPAREPKTVMPAEMRPGDAHSPDESAQTVYQVLLGEVALQRGDLETASAVYADLAARARDPKIFARAVEVAGYARRYDLALATARLWLDAEPTSLKAQQLMAGVMVLSNKLDELAPHLVRMLEVDKAALAENLLGLNRMLARNPDRQAVFRLIDEVCKPFFGVAEAHYTVAVAAVSAGMNERALAEARRALELRPDWEIAALLQGQILLRGSPAQAVTFLQGFVERNPGARDAELQLARVLVADRRYAEAKRHFDRLLLDYPDNPEVVYPVAILALQQNDKALAEAQLKHFLTLRVPDKNYAYYYLGQIAEDSNRSDEALAYYASISGGEQYLPAQSRRAHILQAQGRIDEARKVLADAKVNSPDERVQLLIAEAALLREAKQPQAAFDLLDQALAARPDQPELLYETALLAERLDRMEVLEVRLRKLIEIRPESAQAYNALGFSYAERNQRLPEARLLIEKALQLAPDDSYILDSMGWVLYRQGDLTGALAHLERAYARRDDPEIAAHLGEVLWVLGRKDDARNTLREAQQKFPANEALADAVKKYAP